MNDAKTKTTRDACRVHGVSLNPCLVYERGKVTFGGKTLNVIRDLHLMGYENAAAYLFAGGENGRQLIDILREHNIPFEHEEIEGQTIDVGIESPGKLIVKKENPSVSDENMENLESRLRRNVKSGDIVLVAGSLPRNVSDKKFYELISYFNNAGAISVFDSSDTESFKLAIEASPKIIKPNRKEICDYLKLKQYPSSKLIKVLSSKLRELRDRKNIETILVSLDKDGAILSTEEGDFYACGLDIGIKCTFGAGDALLAGYLLGCLKGLSPEERLRLAIASASSHIAHTLYQGLDFKEVQELQKKVEIEELK